MSAVDRQPVSATSSPNEELARFIARRHPLYEDKFDHWKFLNATYDSGREWFADNIFRYHKEGLKEYRGRVKRAYRFNHTREVVDIVNKYLFKQNVARNTDDAPDSVQNFWKSSLKNGLDMNDLARQMSLRSSIQGRVAIVIDNNATSNIKTKRDERENNVRTYAYIVRTEQILDYAYYEQGALSWIKLAEFKRDDSDPLNSDGTVETRYRLWTKNEWKLYESDPEKGVKELDSGNHSLGIVPVVLLDNVISDHPYESNSLIDDIAYLDRAVANYLSNLDAIIQDQTFSQLVMPAQGILPGEDGKEKVVEMGTKRVFLYDGQGGAAPNYISPDVKQAEIIITTINKIINEIYHTVGLAGERTKQDNAVGIDNSSGVAKAYDFERVNALLSAKAHSLENAENKIARIVAKWGGENVEDDLVTYPDNFDTRGLYDEFDIAAKLILVEAPISVRIEQMKSLNKKLFPQMKKKLREQLEKDIEDMKAALQEISEAATDVFKGDANQGAVSAEGVDNQGG